MKGKLAADHGGVALIELYKGTFAWRAPASFLARPGTELGAAGPDLPHFMVEDTSFVLDTKLQTQPQGCVAFLPYHAFSPRTFKTAYCSKHHR